MKEDGLMKCGIDPGRFKIGVAFAEDGVLLFSAIVPKEYQDDIAAALKNLNWDILSKWGQEGSTSVLSHSCLTSVYIGNGTSSDEIKALLDTGINTEIVDERETTLEGRKLYWKIHPPKGIAKIIPTSMRTPPRDIDDLAAFIIVRRSDFGIK